MTDKQFFYHFRHSSHEGWLMQKLIKYWHKDEPSCKELYDKVSTGDIDTEFKK